MSSAQRWSLVGGAVVIVVVAFLVLRPGGGSSDNRPASGSTAATTHAQGANRPARPATTVIRVRAGQPVGGVKTITVAKGDPVRFAVTSDVADEIHVHGYDFHKDVTAGGTVRFAFPARIDGAFVIELENRATQIASLKVEP